MSSRYFSALPLVDYGGVSTRNLILRSGVAREIVTKYGVFYPYTVRDGERMDTLAFDYYGDSDFFWLVALANDVLDPYHDWPLTSVDFEAYVADKYPSREWALSNVHHYENVDPDVKWWMTPETRAALQPTERIGHDVPVTHYDWEFAANEDKRSIRLLSRKYANRAYSELKRAFFGDRI